MKPNVPWRQPGFIWLFWRSVFVYSLWTFVVGMGILAVLHALGAR
jgi:hypothetical protein